MAQRKNVETKLENGWDIYTVYDYEAHAWWTYAMDQEGLSEGGWYYDLKADAMTYHQELVDELKDRPMNPRTEEFGPDWKLTIRRREG